MDHKTEIGIQEQVSQVKLAIRLSMPPVDIAAIIIALAELQRDMERLLYKYDDERIE